MKRTLNDAMAMIFAASAAVGLLPATVSAQVGNVPLATLDIPIVHVGLFALRPDGSTGGHAVESGQFAGEALSGTTYLAPCAAMGAVSGDRTLPASATEAWRISGRVLALTETQASVQVAWQKVRQAGQDVALPEQTATLTLQRGDRVRLDAVNIAQAGRCPERAASFDVVFASLNEMIPAAVEGLRVMVAGEGDTRGRSEVVTAVEDGKRVTRFLLPGQQRQTAGADLWLVHAVPGSADEIRHVFVDGLRAYPRAFAFPPLVITTDAGVFTVDVQGTIETGLAPDGEPRLFFTASRRVTFAPRGRPARDTAPVVGTSSKTTMAMPGPDDVLAFEMPPLQVPGGGTLPNKLSIRVKLSQTTAQQPRTENR